VGKNVNVNVPAVNVQKVQQKSEKDEIADMLNNL
jgi:hypothetical protein